MINMSRVVSAIKQSMGLYNITLPFKSENGDQAPTENIIMDILKTQTIPEFSQFVPWTRDCQVNITDLKVISETESIYEIPKILTLTPIMSVIDVSMPFHNNRGTFGDVAPAYGINRSVQGVATSQAYMMLAGQMRAEPTFEYLENNQIRLYGYPKTIVNIKVAAEHMANGESIPAGCYDSFMELAVLDMKIFLYNTLKHYDGIPTAFGEIKLKTEDYQSAEADRKELLEGWRDRYHVDQIDWIAFM
jgi:hypothetical protein